MKELTSAVNDIFISSIHLFKYGYMYVNGNCYYLCLLRPNWYACPALSCIGPGEGGENIYPLAQDRILTSHWPFLGEKPPLGIRKKHGINEKKKRNNFFFHEKENRNGSVQWKLKRNDTENSKQIFPESPNFHIHVSVSDFILRNCVERDEEVKRLVGYNGNLITLMCVHPFLFCFFHTMYFFAM
jgi:hypothetical protein